MAMTNNPIVNVVSREQWGAVPPKIETVFTGRAQRVVIHHTALEGCTSLQECTKQLVSIQRFHMTERGFDDIGYNFIVSADGILFEGRGWRTVGAHAKDNNADSLGIAVMDNFNDQKPTEQVIQAIRTLLQAGVSQGFLEKGFTLYGHRDLGSTECPGEHLYAALPQLRSTP